MNGWYGRARSAARYGTRALCSAVIRGAPRRARRRVGATSRFRFGTSNRDTRVRRDDASNKHRISSRLSSCTKALTVRVKSWVPPRVSCVSCVSSRLARRVRIGRASRPAAKSANESNLPTSGAFIVLRRGGRHVGAAALPERGVPVGHAVGLVTRRRRPRSRRRPRGRHGGGGAGIASSIWPSGVRGTAAPKPRSHILHHVMMTSGRERNSRTCMPSKNLGAPW